MIISTILIAAVQAGTLQGGALVSAQESVMLGAEVRLDPPSPISFYGRALLGDASLEELEAVAGIIDSNTPGGGDSSNLDWQRFRLELGSMWKIWDATALGNGGFLNLGAEAVRGSHPGRQEQLEEHSIIPDTDSSYWLQPIVEAGAALNVPFLARFEIKQSVGFSFPIWATGFVFNNEDGKYLDDLADQYDTDFDRGSFSNPYFETVTTMTGEAGLSWFSIRTRIRSYSTSEFYQVVLAASGDEIARDSLEIMPEFVFGVGF